MRVRLPSGLTHPLPRQSRKERKFPLLEDKKLFEMALQGARAAGLGEGRRAPDSLPTSGPQPLPPRGRRKDTSACGAA